MKKDRSFHDYVIQDRLGKIPGITSRAMFGGWGVYKDGIIFAIIDDDQLYFKVDDQLQPEFEQLGSSPFVYSPSPGKTSWSSKVSSVNWSC